MKKDKNLLTLTGCIYTNTLLLNDIIVGKILNQYYMTVAFHVTKKMNVLC